MTTAELNAATTTELIELDRAIARWMADACKRNNRPRMASLLRDRADVRAEIDRRKAG